MKKLLLIDANSLIHRAFHALPPLTNKSGEVIQAVYGISTILLKLWKEDKPDYAAALFDRPEPTFRDAKYAEYKAQRAETDVELINQLPKMPDIFGFWGVRSFDAKGFEADDLIATLAHKFGEEKDLQVVILTGDMDTLQLVKDSKVVVRAFKKGVSETITYDADAVRERYGLGPEQMIDYKSLVGDQSDNIKGIAGIGPKTACGILNEFGNLDDALKNLPEGRIKEKLLVSEKDIELLRELVTLRKDAPIKIENLESLEVKENYEGLAKFFEEQGFKTLLNRLSADKAPSSSQGSIF